jgi:hypothetical protein
VNSDLIRGSRRDPFAPDSFRRLHHEAGTSKRHAKAERAHYHDASFAKSERSRGGNAAAACAVLRLRGSAGAIRASAIKRISAVKDLSD